MARKDPVFRPQISAEMSGRIADRMALERYTGSRQSWVEGVILRYLDGLLVEVPRDADVRAVRVKHQGKDEHRKAG